MLWKLLLLAAPLSVAFFLFRLRLRLRRPGRAAPSAPPAMVAEWRRLVRRIAYGLAVLLLGGSALYFYLDWRAREAVISVRVVNIYTGEGVGYQARRGDVGWRRFTTRDGRQITLAEVERLEIEEPR